MCVRYLLCFLLGLLPGVLYAQSAAQSCSAPNLDGGYFVPEQAAYSHDTTLTYACDRGRKPAAEGWWATSTCQNGKWLPEPQCIDANGCLPLTIPHGEYTEDSDGWFKEGEKERVKCNEGFYLKNWDATAVCLNGTWTSVPICEKSITACGEPPKIPHAVIVGQKYKEVFAADSNVQYECEEGYTVEGEESKKTIICISGNWTEGPTCRATRPESGSGGSTVGGSRPGTGHGAAGGGSTPSGGSAVRPVHLTYCGNSPTVPNGEVFQSTELFLKYQCNHYYKLEGPATVYCYSNGLWSEKPTCRVAFCTVNTDGHPDLVPVGVQFIKEGEEMEFRCVDKWSFTNYAVGRCMKGRLWLSRCCNRGQITFGVC
ncbi:complement factor H-like [Cheilinus undulatus]|uniref:complement factor H-like n=1 Tax=Cheilinus undulatus TaxID=241271 RepID=UPI001BD28559|nr:complement factor H-like [Cheilinus undulatus]